MKAEELRIGNLVWTDYSGEMLVSAIMDDKKNQYLCLRKNENFPDGRYIIGDVSGIPLTEEWLVRMGFNNTAIKWMDKSVSNPVFIKKDKYYLEFVDGEYYFNLFFGMSNNPVHLTAIKYVHQLQNLYFALTGEELTIKPQER